jgi:hypothetical protein
MDIDHRYGIRVKGHLVPYGTENIKTAQFRAKLWQGQVVDLAAIGRKFEKMGHKVNYTYRK